MLQCCCSPSPSPSSLSASTSSSASRFPLRPPPPPPPPLRFHFQHQSCAPSPASLSSQSRRYNTPLHAKASSKLVADEIVAEEEEGFVEIGYISSVHGLQGEVRVKSMTDFQELRFSYPGKRWLRQSFAGKETVREVELVEGRGQPGQKSWILKFDGIDNVDEAKLLVGSSLLVREEDRPELEDGEFYTRDLIGMRVFLKETGELVGTVVNVFESGASDLLQVMLNASVDTADITEKGEAGTESSGPLVLIPFVEAIVPDVDLDGKELKITPPKGLLELNIRPDGMSKKEKRQLEWREQKKFQRRLITAKKQLCQLEQQHIFHGFLHGDKDQRDLLASQIVDLNSKLLKEAMLQISEPRSSKRLELSEFIRDNSNSLMKNTLSVTAECLTPGESEKQGNESLLKKGTQLMSRGKVAMVLVVSSYTVEGLGFEPASAASPGAEDTSFSILRAILEADQRFVKLEDRALMPLIIICPARELIFIEELFLEHNYFSFDREKVWFYAEEKLPIITPALELASKHKILMKSPWEMHQSPIGSGGVLSFFASSNMLEELSKLGVEYIEVCSVNERYVGGHTELCGLVSSRGGHVGIQISQDRMSSEEAFDILFSMDYMKKLTKQVNMLQFIVIPTTCSHVEKPDKEWIEVTSSSLNANELYCSIYSFLSACSVDEICIMEITE